MPTLTFKVTDTEAAAIRQAAKEKRIGISEFLRESAKAQATPPPPQVIMKRHPLSGGWYNAAPGQPDYTLEELKSSLEDFP